MNISRRDFLRASAAIVSAPGLLSCRPPGLPGIPGGEATGPVIWLQGQSCSGCSVSLLNTIYYATADELLLDIIDLKYHPTLMTAAGDLAVSAAEDTRAAGGYILVVEGSIPTGAQGKYCHAWPGMTMQDALAALSSDASFILAVGTCAAYGGLIAANTNPTQAESVSQVLGNDPRIINIPGCPSHPDWIVGTIAYLLETGQAPPLDSRRRPLDYFRERIHEHCPERERDEGYGSDDDEARWLSDRGCMEELGCRGKRTRADCYVRQWNSGEAGQFGVNWCIGARSPCHGCVEPEFPGMEPFFEEHDD